MNGVYEQVKSHSVSMIFIDFGIMFFIDGARQVVRFLVENCKVACV